VIAFLNAGATVIAPVRSHGGERALLEDVESVFSRSPSNLHIVVVPDFATIQGMRSLVSVLRERGHKTLHHVVSSFGGPFPKGHLSVLSPENIHSAVDRAVPHMILTQNMMDLVVAGSSKSSFTFISGSRGKVSHAILCIIVSCKRSFVFDN
jgi:creatinine amidohydrolase/Fe(II)-dependent formamide hydrolase-like protein